MRGGMRYEYALGDKSIYWGAHLGTDTGAYLYGLLLGKDVD